MRGLHHLPGSTSLGRWSSFDTLFLWDLERADFMHCEDHPLKLTAFRPGFQRPESKIRPVASTLEVFSCGKISSCLTFLVRPIALRTTLVSERTRGSDESYPTSMLRQLRPQVCLALQLPSLRAEMMQKIDAPFISPWNTNKAAPCSREMRGSRSSKAFAEHICWIQLWSRSPTPVFPVCANQPLLEQAWILRSSQILGDLADSRTS